MHRPMVFTTPGGEGRAPVSFVVVGGRGNGNIHFADHGCGYGESPAVTVDVVDAWMDSEMMKPTPTERLLGVLAMQDETEHLPDLRLLVAIARRWWMGPPRRQVYANGIIRKLFDTGLLRAPLERMTPAMRALCEERA